MTLREFYTFIQSVWSMVHDFYYCNTFDQNVCNDLYIRQHIIMDSYKGHSCEKQLALITADIVNLLITSSRKGDNNGTK